MVVRVDLSGCGKLTDDGKSKAEAAGGVKKACPRKFVLEEVVAVLLDATGANVVERACRKSEEVESASKAGKLESKRAKS